MMPKDLEELHRKVRQAAANLKTANTPDSNRIRAKARTRLLQAYTEEELEKLITKEGEP